MFNKLAWRNVKRSFKDYLVYFLTMTIVVALMYSFSSLIFYEELEAYVEMNDFMGVMLVIATVFIVLIVAWLIHYMVRFMLEKRSSEFGIYLLLGMKQKEISRMYMRENIVLGFGAFVTGGTLGIFLQQILMTVLYSLLGKEYQMHLFLNRNTIYMVILCYCGCYLLALLRCQRKFRKMNIQGLLHFKRANEEIKEKGEELKKWIFPLSIFFILLFWVFFSHLSSTGEIAVFLVGLVLTIYLFYTGISACIICYIRRRGKGIFHGQRLFLLRQFSSKMHTMQFTMGTLTALFTLALMGASVAFMFHSYENTVLDGKFPFDILIYSSSVEDDFSAEKKIIQENAKPEKFYPYHIYTDQENQVNTWMLTHLSDWRDWYQKEDGTLDLEGIKEELEEGGNYCAYDTYMGLTDYNNLRSMLGYEEIKLEQGTYAIQIKERLKEEVETIGKDLKIQDENRTGFLTLNGIYSEPFSQDGHNGGDYLVVVPDDVLQRMQPYYSELAVSLEGKASETLQDKLDELHIEEYNDFAGNVVPTLKGNSCSGSDKVLVFVAKNLVRSSMIQEAKVLLASMILPMFYIGLVFLCVAVTVLSVQQLSDADRYGFRYEILEKMGLSFREVQRLIFRQLAAYYLCPAILAVVISGKMMLFLGKQFVHATGIPVATGAFFMKSLGLFFSIYLVYFLVTCVGFSRSIQRKRGE